MKLGKFKKITMIEISTFALLLIALGIYFSPNFMLEKEVMYAAKIKADNSIFTAKVLEEFAVNKEIKASEAAQKVAEELNIVTRNPYNKKMPAYTFETTCKACNSVSFDDEAQMVVVTTYNKKNELIARTVIKPPSFVNYFKYEDKN